MMTGVCGLAVQVDGGEWTHFLFIYYAWLIQGKKVTEVILSKLPVGHTHNDQDSRFGRISHMLFGKKGKRGSTPGYDCYSPNHFIMLIHKCFEALNGMQVHTKQWW
jgi:hypothetical protein